MAFARWQATIVDEAGNIIPNPFIEVRRETAGAALATLYDNRDGTGDPLGNPFQVDTGDGFAFLHVIGGFYKIRAYDPTTGFERIWRDVGIGTASGFDATIFTNANRITARVATTGNVTIATALNNGDTIDDVVLATNDIVLVKSQTDPAQNGLIVVGVSPARHADFDTFDEHAGAMVAVSSGTANGNKLFFCAVNAGGTLGTTALTFTRLDAVVGADGDPGEPGSSDVVGTSASSVAIGTGSKTFTIVESDRGWGVGARLRISSDANPTTHFMEGVVAAYATNTLQVTVDLTAGSGSRADWTVNLAGEPGEDGADGATGDLGIRTVTAAGAVTVSNTDEIILLNKTSGAATSVNFPAASGYTGRGVSLKDIKGDAGTNNITPVFNGAETCDGVAGSEFVINVNYGEAGVFRPLPGGAGWYIHRR